MGVPSEGIAAYLAKDAIAAGEEDIEVLEENWDAVRVYRFCHWETVVMSNAEKCRLIWRGIATQEIESVARMLDVRGDEDLLSRVRVITQEAAQVLNED